MKLESGKDKMFTLVGKGVSPGLAKGKAFVYRDVLQRDSELYVIDRIQIGEEKARIEKAIDDVRQSLHIDAKQIEGKLGKHSANIFLAQEAILLDSFVVEEMKRILEAELINAEQVVRTVFRLLARRFRDLNNEVLRERGDDIDDLSRRLLLVSRNSCTQPREPACEHCAHSTSVSSFRYGVSIAFVHRRCPCRVRWSRSACGSSCPRARHSLCGWHS
jgi:phosphoenolpyruvate-protein kinase (PTS system EI component)